MAEHFPVIASVLSPERLVTSVLGRYELGGPVRCRFFRRGVNDTYEVWAGKTPYFLRVFCHAWRTRREIEGELEVLEHLREDGVGVSHALRRRDGRYLTRVRAPEGARWAVLFTAAAGTPPQMDLARSASYGKLVAQVHASLDRMQERPGRFQLDLDHLVVSPLNQIAKHRGSQGKDMDYLESLGGLLAERIDALLPREAPLYGGCHGDHHGGNVHMDGSGRLTLFDFDCGGYGWRSYDVAVFLWHLSLRYGINGTGRAKATRRWNAFLTGYGDVRELSPNEVEATRLFVPARHIWLMGLHVGGAERFGHSFVGNAYFDRQVRFLRRWDQRENLTCQ